MDRTIEYIGVMLIGIGLVLLMVKPLVEKTANSLIQSAEYFETAVQ